MTIFDLAQRPGELYALSALIGECDSLCASGDLNESQESALRLVVAHTRAAFKLPSKADERAFQPPITDDQQARLLQWVRDNIDRDDLLEPRR